MLHLERARGVTKLIVHTKRGDRFSKNNFHKTLWNRKANRGSNRVLAFAEMENTVKTKSNNMKTKKLYL